VSLRPSFSLFQVTLETFRRQTGRQPFADIDGAIARGVETDRRMDVLRRRTGQESADRFQRRPAQESAGPAVKGRIISIAAGLNLIEKELLLVQHLPRQPEIFLIWIRIVEMMGDLHQRDGGILKVAHRSLQQGLDRDMIGVKIDDQFAPCMLQGIIEIAGLGVLIGRPAQVVASEPFGHRPHLGSVAVIQDINPLLPLRCAHCLTPDERAVEHVERLIKNRHVDINGGPPVGGGWR
jgi:hypothetical protein